MLGKLTVHNTIVISLGPVGHRMAQQFDQVMRRRHPGRDVPGIAFLPLLDEVAGRAAVYSPPAVGIALQPYERLPELATAVAPNLVPAGSPNPHEYAAALRGAPRQRGQVCLAQHAEVIVDRLAALRQTIFSRQATALRLEHDIEVINPDRLTVFVLLSLADSFMSGLLPDLPYLVRHALSVGMADDRDVTIHLVLALPGFDGEVADPAPGAATAEAATQRAEARHRVQALAAACLRETDYWFGRPNRPRPYQRALSDRLRLDFRASPLGEGRIILIQPLNESGVQLDSVDMLAAMVGDWLYYMSCSRLSDLLSPPSAQDLTAYSTIGHGSLIVPIELWQRQAAARLKTALLGRLALSRGAQWTPRMDAYRAELGLTRDGLRAHLLHRVDSAAPLPGRARNASLTRPRRLLDALQDGYSGQMADLMTLRARLIRRERQLTEWPDAEERDRRRADQLEDSLPTRLEDTVGRILDDPAGGMAEARDFLDGLRQRLAAEAADLRAERLALEQSAQNQGPGLITRRVELFGRALVAGGPAGLPFFWLAALVVLLAAVAAIVAMLLWPVGPVVVGVGLGVLLLGAAYGATREADALRFARADVARAYDKRLQDWRAYELLRAQEMLYQDLIAGLDAETPTVIGQLREQVNRLTKLLSETNAAIDRARRRGLGDVNRLCAGYQEGISRSLLSPAIVEGVEAQSRLRRIDEQLDLLRDRLGSPGQWLARWGGEGPSPGPGESFAERLAAFAQEQAREALADVNLVMALGQTAPQEATRRFQELLAATAPYGQLDATTRSRMGPPRAIVAATEQFNLTRHFGRLADGRPATGATTSRPGSQADPLREQANLDPLAIEDPHQLVLSTVRHGLRLRLLPYYTQVLAVDFDATPAQALYWLPSLPDRLTLPDPRADDATTPAARHLFILGRALSLLDVDDRGDVSWDGQSLGNDPLSVVGRLQDEALAEEIRQGIADRNKYGRMAAIARGWAARPGPTAERWVREAVEEALAAWEADGAGR